MQRSCAQQFKLDEKFQDDGAYTQRIGFSDGVRVDIPKGFEDILKYNGTLPA